MTSKTISIAQFIQAIRKLQPDTPVNDPRTWYKTQKEHWLGWLSEYHGPGAYGRKSEKRRDAKYAYNHIVDFKMLLWLAEAAGVEPNLVRQARSSAKQANTLMAKSAAVRRHISWETLSTALWKP